MKVTIIKNGNKISLQDLTIEDLEVIRKQDPDTALKLALLKGSDMIAELGKKLGFDDTPKEDSADITTGCGFGAVLQALKQGQSAQRVTWEDDVRIVLIPSHTITVEEVPLNVSIQQGTKLTLKEYIGISDGEGDMMVFTPEQEDLLAEDWIIINS